MDIDLVSSVLGKHFAGDHHCFGIRCGNCDHGVAGTKRSPIMLRTLVWETQ